MTEPEPKIIEVPIHANHGEPLLGVEGIALICGVTTDEIRYHAAFGTDFDSAAWLPLELRKQARRRTREAQAHTGIDSLQAALEYWAETEHGAEIRLVLRGDAE